MPTILLQRGRIVRTLAVNAGQRQPVGIVVLPTGAHSLQQVRVVANLTPGNNPAPVVTNTALLGYGYAPSLTEYLITAVVSNGVEGTNPDGSVYTTPTYNALGAGIYAFFAFPATWQNPTIVDQATGMAGGFLQVATANLPNSGINGPTVQASKIWRSLNEGLGTISVRITWPNPVI